MNRCSLLSWSSCSAFVAPLANYMPHNICSSSYVYQHHNILKINQLLSRLYSVSSPPTPPKFPASPWHHITKDIGLHQQCTNNINTALITSNLVMTNYTADCILQHRAQKLCLTITVLTPSQFGR